MPSIRSQLINSLIRNRHLMKGQLKRETWDFNTSVQAFRDECERGASRIKLPEGIEAVPVTIEGLPAGLSAEWVKAAGTTPITSNNSPVIFFTHGGGYVSGSCSDHRGHVAKLVEGSGVPALLFEYRLAPEHPFPAGMEDSLTAYRWLLAQGASPEHIVIVGDSAGAGLCLALLLALRDLGLPLPKAAVAVSPWTDLLLTGESHRTRVHAAVDPLNMSKVCSKYYAGDNDPANPWISPLYGDLHGLPTIRIYVGNDEMLRDDSVLFAAKAAAAGVDIHLTVAEGQVHCYPFLAPLFPEAVQAMAEINAFIKAQVALEQPAPMREKV